MNVGLILPTYKRKPFKEDGTWTLNGEKLWCTNGVVADVIVGGKNGYEKVGSEKLVVYQHLLLKQDWLVSKSFIVVV